MTKKNLFDFADVSDLPEDLQGKLTSDNTDVVKEYADIVVKGAEAGYDALSVNQIIAVAHRMGKEVPTQQTVRGYLNKAVDLKLISKPTRLTYGIAKGKVKKEDVGLDEVQDAVVTSEETPSVDPLADL